MSLFSEKKSFFGRLSEKISDVVMLRSAVDEDLMDELEETMREVPADIAVLTLPASAAQKAAERLYACGVRGFWNYAPVDLHLPQDAAVVSVHLDESLELLGYRLEHNEG